MPDNKDRSQTEDLSAVYLPLRLVYGLVPLLAGLDKFAGVLTDWGKYVSPALASWLPVSTGTFLGLVGVVEIAAGLLVLAGLARSGGYVVAAWLLSIALNLVLAGFLDVAVRDLAMAVGAYALSQIAALRGEALVPGFELPRMAREPHHAVR